MVASGDLEETVVLPVCSLSLLDAKIRYHKFQFCLLFFFSFTHICLSFKVRDDFLRQRLSYLLRRMKQSCRELR
jgi:hypothetical protein